MNHQLGMESQAPGLTFVIPELGKLRQEYCNKFKINLTHIVNSRPQDSILFGKKTSLTVFEYDNFAV